MRFFLIVHDKNIWFGFVWLPHRRPILWPHVYIFIPANDSTVGRDGMLPLRAPLTPSWWRDPDAITSVTTGYTTQLRSRVFCLFSLMLSNFIIHLRGGSERNQFPLMCIMGVLFIAQKSVSLPYDLKFCQRCVCSPWGNSSFRTLGSIFRLFVSKLLSLFTNKPRNWSK